MTPKQAAIVAAMVLSFVTGGVGQYVHPGTALPPTDIWLMPLFVFAVFVWYWHDARQRGYRRTPWLDVAVVAIAILALPWYFVRSRGWRQGLVASGWLLLCALAAGVLGIAGEYAVYYGLQA